MVIGYESGSTLMIFVDGVIKNPMGSFKGVDMQDMTITIQGRKRLEWSYLAI